MRCSLPSKMLETGRLPIAKRKARTKPGFWSSGRQAGWSKSVLRVVGRSRTVGRRIAAISRGSTIGRSRAIGGGGRIRRCGRGRGRSGGLGGGGQRFANLLG